MIRDSLADGGKRPLDLTAVDRVLECIPPETRGNTEFLVGRYLFIHGKRDAARKHLERCADSKPTYSWLRVIAKEGLRSPSPTAARAPRARRG
jgi:hypothetical protein